MNILAKYGHHYSTLLRLCQDHLPRPLGEEKCPSTSIKYFKKVNTRISVPDLSFTSMFLNSSPVSFFCQGHQPDIALMAGAGSFFVLSICYSSFLVKGSSDSATSRGSCDFVKLSPVALSSEVSAFASRILLLVAVGLSRALTEGLSNSLCYRTKHSRFVKGQIPGVFLFNSFSKISQGHTKSKIFASSLSRSTNPTLERPVSHPPHPPRFTGRVSLLTLRELSCESAVMPMIICSLLKEPPVTQRYALRSGFKPQRRNPVLSSETLLL